MVKKSRSPRPHVTFGSPDTTARTKSITMVFVFSVIFIGLMLFAVAKSTNWLSFARSPEQMMSWCMNNYPPDLCKGIQALQNGGTNDPDLAAWCRGKCGDYGKEAKICKSVCVAANSGSSCSAACGQYTNPTISKQCKARCPSLIKPTATPTASPTPTTAP